MSASRDTHFYAGVKPMLSVIVPAHNDGDTIERALCSILEQKVNFNYEILVGDDASSDSTAAVVRDYQSRYPDIIKPVIRTHPLGYTKNVYDLLCLADGRFIAYLGASDCWCDCHKLQMMTDHLLGHPEFIACCHRSAVMDDDGIFLDSGSDRTLAKEIFTSRDFGAQPPAHISALLHRNIFDSPEYDYSIIYKASGTDIDRTIFMLLSAQGDIYRYPYVMSRYCEQVSHEDADEALAREYSTIHALERYAAANFPGVFDLGPQCDRLFEKALRYFIACPSPDTITPLRKILSSTEHPMKYIGGYIARKIKK
ncbi:MAG: glycosyltransferase family 2 protein [Clostridia bacterium]|nr:glycosyltransferase family 2 protein [Clostridia bacterium]